jgi:DNA-binding ferritin-like protein (Dps family)
MSNRHLRDAALSLKAKGLLSQMLSLPENWNYTLKGLAKINRENVSAIRTAVRELEQAGYIVRRQGRDQSGKMAANIYTVYEEPQTPSPPRPLCDFPTTDNPTTVFPTSEKPTSENRTQLNKDKAITDKSNTDLSNTESNPIPVPQSGRAASPDGIGTESTDVYREIIKENIEYGYMTERHDRRAVDEIVDLMLETVCAARKTIRVAGDDYPAELVKSKLLKLDSTHIDYVFECLKENTSDIRNIKKYMLAVLFNAPSTIDSYYSARVRHDLYGG